MTRNRLSTQDTEVQGATEEVSTRSLAGSRELAKTFMGKVSPAQSQLSRNNFATKTENGTDMVNIGGMWTNVKAAARMGLI